MVSNRMMWGVLAVAAGAGMACSLFPARNRRVRVSHWSRAVKWTSLPEDSFPASDSPSSPVRPSPCPAVRNGQGTPQAEDRGSGRLDAGLNI